LTETSDAWDPGIRVWSKRTAQKEPLTPASYGHQTSTERNLKAIAIEVRVVFATVHIEPIAVIMSSEPMAKSAMVDPDA